MKFIAIDFETANSKLSSPCSLGMAVVENGKIIDQHYWLIKPEPFEFHPINIGIHGITPEMTRDSPTFYELWTKLENLFRDNIIIAHNAGFDMGVLRKTLDHYNITYPNVSYFCSMKLYQKMLPDSISYKLPMLSRTIGYKFKHHNALEDSIACAKLIINALQESNRGTIEELADLYKVSIGEIYPDGYSPCSISLKGMKSRNKKKVYEITPDADLPDIDGDNYFTDKIFVITGPLSNMSKQSALQQIVNHGGAVGDYVSRKINVLIVGQSAYDQINTGKMSNKLKKAFELKKEGFDIELLSEEAFMEFLCL